MLDDTDQRNKAAQLIIAKSLLKLADASNDQPEQLNSLAEIANAICASQFWFLDWQTIANYLDIFANGDLDYEHSGKHFPRENDLELRARIEADITSTETETKDSSNAASGTNQQA